MLEPAINYRIKAQTEYQSIMFQDKMKFYFKKKHIDYSLDIQESMEEKIQMVSVDPETYEVVGFFSTSVDWDTRIGRDVSILNFKEKNHIFDEDWGRFFFMLFEQFGLKKLTWNIIIGNKAEKLYDRLAENFGGRIVGTFKDDVMLYDGRLYDVKYYELFGKDFINGFINNEATIHNYRRVGFHE